MVEGSRVVAGCRGTSDDDASGLRDRYDARGAIIAQAALDQSGRPTFNAGVVREALARDSQGRPPAFGRSTRSNRGRPWASPSDALATA